jgi:hypothetical protein
MSELALHYFLVRCLSAVLSAVLQAMPVLPEPVDAQQWVHAYSSAAVITFSELALYYFLVRCFVCCFAAYAGAA